MIHFAYPSIQENHLVFCGRFVYLPSCPPEFNQGFQQVRIGNDRVSHLEDAQNAAEEFVPKSTENKSKIYECQENPRAYYMGNSLLLAYLLALINTCRKVKWEENSSDLYDILCTGDINFKSDVPLLKDVDAAGFDKKLEYLAEYFGLLGEIPPQRGNHNNNPAQFEYLHLLVLPQPVYRNNVAMRSRHRNEYSVNHP